MIKRFLPILVLLGGFSMMACEPTNPYNTGPAYDIEANLAIDSVKIAAFLDTAQIDSIYRIHDPSGVVIIVQEEGAGSRPTTNTVVYTNYTGSLMEGGSVFDTSIESVARENDLFVEGRDYLPFSFVMGTNSVIYGWELGFRRLRPGTKAVMIIPSPYAYRDQVNNSRIPANSILLFEVDFLGID
ncbi:FKBP-type peptidyl-prolyl cis-trans isomerase [Algoriphagus sp. A40]|uniref:FKBP-type peptidyl-prolyl cis-trans isomerase n=1 Tax=Algoriphagus sp. A40 TaxID=1945863 RepID=UPI0009CFD563|nr:FKBP-type peptidyl-prolyl cis-trans isomerase [Algoriphagus sp. A40]OOG70438.1 FKBP-type peptidylprolyl isomerase [Algoriphagus sp. A40]